MAFTLRVTDGEAGETHERSYAQQEVLVGRDAAVDLRLDSDQVSLVHLALRQQRGRLLAEDRGSTNGTRLDGDLLPPGEPQPLRAGSALALGPFRLEVVHAPGEPGVAPAARRQDAVLQAIAAAAVLLATAALIYLLLS